MEFGGSGQINEHEHFSFPKKWHSFSQHIKIKVPPFAISIFKQIDQKIIGGGL